MNREERRHLYGRLRAGIATRADFLNFKKNIGEFNSRAQGRDHWRETLRALVASQLPSRKTRNARKALVRSRRSS